MYTFKLLPLPYTLLLVGKLSHWIQLALSDDQSNDYLLIDRSNPKRKVSHLL